MGIWCVTVCKQLVPHPNYAQNQGAPLKDKAGKPRVSYCAQAKHEVDTKGGQEEEVEVRQGMMHIGLIAPYRSETM